MCCSSFLSALAVILTACAGTVSARSALPTPEFEPLFIGRFTPGAGRNTTGPFGTCIHFDIIGGDLADAKTGKRVATILLCADDGIIGSSGVFFPKAVVPLIRAITMTGVGTLGVRDMLYAHVETDSPTYSGTNSKFFIIKVEAMGEESVITIYGVSNASPSY